MTVLVLIVAAYCGCAAFTGWTIGRVEFGYESDRTIATVVLPLFAPIGFLLSIAWLAEEAGRRRAVEQALAEEVRAEKHKAELEVIREVSRLVSESKEIR